MDNKETFVMYKSYIDAVEKLPNNEDKLELLLGICNYSLYGIEPIFNSFIVEAIFIAIKPNINSAKSRYKASVENGKKGGAPKGNSNAKKQSKTTQEQPNETTKNNLYDDVDDNVDDNVDVNEKVDVNENEEEIKYLMKSKHMTRQEVLDYINSLPSINQIGVKNQTKTIFDTLHEI